MIQSVRKGDRVEIVFQDHAQSGLTFEFEVFGRVLMQTRKDITVVCWNYTDRKKRIKLDDYNLHVFSIAKNGIKSIRKLCYQSS